MQGDAKYLHALNQTRTFGRTTSTVNTMDLSCLGGFFQTSDGDGNKC